MRGGYFEQKQFEIEYIIEEIKNVVSQNHKTNIFGEKINYSQDVINEMMRGVSLLNQAFVYANRIDSFLCGDESEKAFLSNLKKTCRT